MKKVVARVGAVLRHFAMVGFAIPFLMTSGGCSVWMATHQEAHHDLNVLKAGHSRSEVLAELGEVGRVGVAVVVEVEGE